MNAEITEKLKTLQSFLPAHAAKLSNLQKTKKEDVFKSFTILTDPDAKNKQIVNAMVSLQHFRLCFIMMLSL